MRVVDPTPPRYGTDLITQQDELLHILEVGGFLSLHTLAIDLSTLEYGRVSRAHQPLPTVSPVSQDPLRTIGGAGPEFVQILAPQRCIGSPGSAWAAQ